MKLNQKALALCALVALPMGAVIAEPTTATKDATEATAGTQEITFKVSGMT